MKAEDFDRCAVCANRRTCVFSKLPATARREFQRISVPRVYRRGQVIVRQGEEASGVFNVRSGAVRLHHLTPCGKSGASRIVAASGVLGLTEVAAGSRFQFTAEALQNSTLEYAPSKQFESFLLDNAQVAVQLLVWVSREFEKQQSELYETATGGDLAPRLLGRLRQLGELCGSSTPEGVELSPIFTGQDLADSLGCSRQWVCKLLGDLEHQGLVKRRARRIILTAAALGCGAGGG